MLGFQEYSFIIYKTFIFRVSPYLVLEPWRIIRALVTTVALKLHADWVSGTVLSTFTSAS